MDMITGLKSLGCDTDGALARLCGDRELYKGLITDYLNSVSFLALLNAVKVADYSTAFSEAHNMKGVFGNLGITPLYSPACKLTELFRAGKTEGADVIIHDMISSKDTIDAFIGAAD